VRPVLGKLAIYMQKTETRPLALCIKKPTPNGSKILRLEMLKLLLGKIWKTLKDIGIVNYSLNRSLIA
jgi:hypothetical protein